MNSICIYVEEYAGDSIRNLHGINFSNSLFVKLLIDGDDIESLENFEDVLIYYKELRKSLEGDGKYLILTCACGIAEDGGWEGVQVRYDDMKVHWTFDAGDLGIHYSFCRTEYENEIQSIAESIQNTDLEVQPSGVIYPPGY
jgi:hypothetical protein